MKFTCEICEKGVAPQDAVAHAEKHKAARGNARNAMDVLSDEERLEVMRHYYSCCGTKHTANDGGYCPKCQR